MTETLYTISQLAEIAGVTPRTIRYYTAEGLLPRPDTRGQYALYGEEHLLRLRLIGKLKQAYLPLGEIKARIEDLNIEQVRHLIEEYQHPATPAPLASAGEYLAQVHARQPMPPALRRMAERAESYAAAETPKLSLSAPTDTDAPEPPRSGASPVYGFAAPIVGPAAPQPPAPPAALPQQPGLLRKLIPQRRNSDSGRDARAQEVSPETAQDEDEQRWRRVVLAHGVELHVREPVAAALRQPIERLIAQARTLFEIRD